MHFKDIFIDMNPNALRKAKIVYKVGLSECSRIKRKTIVLSKNIKIILFAIFSYFFLTIKNRNMHSEKKKVFKKKKKVSYLPTLFFFML